MLFFGWRVLWKVGIDWRSLVTSLCSIRGRRLNGGVMLCVGGHGRFIWISSRHRWGRCGCRLRYLCGRNDLSAWESILLLLFYQRWIIRLCLIFRGCFYLRRWGLRINCLVFSWLMHLKILNGEGMEVSSSWRLRQNMFIWLWFWYWILSILQRRRCGSCRRLLLLLLWGTAVRGGLSIFCWQSHIFSRLTGDRFNRVRTVCLRLRIDIYRGREWRERSVRWSCRDVLRVRWQVRFVGFWDGLYRIFLRCCLRGFVRLRLLLRLCLIRDLRFLLLRNRFICLWEGRGRNGGSRYDWVLGWSYLPRSRGLDRGMRCFLSLWWGSLVESVRLTFVVRICSWYLSCFFRVWDYRRDRWRLLIGCSPWWLWSYKTRWW